MIILSTTVGRNPLEEMGEPSWSTKESEMQYLDAITKMTECFYFQNSGRWIIEDPAVIYVRECFAYVLL